MILICLLIGYRLITPEMIESGGDALAKWWLARRASDTSFAVMGNDHHSARFGINLVTYLVQQAFGTHPVVYYVPAYLMSAVEVVFLYLICRRVTGIWPAAVAVIGLILHPLMIRNGAQLLPGVFSGAYIMGALFFLAMCFDAKAEKIALYRTVSALFFFAAYLSKVPNLFFLPALVLGVWGIRRERRDVLWFLGLLLVLAALEWSFYVFVKGHFYGRLVSLHGHYNGVIKFVANQLPDEYLTLNWLDLLKYRYAPKFMGGETVAYIFYAALGCAVYLVARAPPGFGPGIARLHPAQLRVYQRDRHQGF
ncbi:MAG: glycosyltransferase family 39 protein [Alphaproteobacteria bacterium]|nr:glycosyltransferase family 39 protein [Alphaproteobacteria bacterium]